MTLLIDVEKLPRNVLETAIKLNDPLKNIYIILYCYGESTAPKEIAKKLGHARAHIHMRLCQLESMGLAKKIYEKNRVKFKAIHWRTHLANRTNFQENSNISLFVTNF